MNIIKISQDYPEPQILKMTSRVILNEEVIIHPTETVYGFAAQYSSMKAIKKILKIKKRKLSHPMSIMVADINQILELSGQTGSVWLMDILSNLLPSPLTILIPRKRNLNPDYWDQFQKLGFRFPDHILSQKLLDSTGIPIITTSANISGEPAVSTAQDLPNHLKDQVSIVLDGGPTQERIASTILDVDLETKQIKQVREGALSWEEIKNRIA
jgi:L-threonylcarbamoyladenylate synthase